MTWMSQPMSPLTTLPPLPEDLGKRLEDAVYVSVGFGVLAVQQAQVRRRELQRLAGQVWRDLQQPAPGS